MNLYSEKFIEDYALYNYRRGFKDGFVMAGVFVGALLIVGAIENKKKEKNHE